MARKTTSKKTTSKKTTSTKARPAGKTVVEDNYIAPKLKKKADEEVVTFAQALEEAGQTIDELRPPKPGEAPIRPVGESNLARTIRSRRASYAIALHPNSGKKTQNNGDEVAVKLLSISLEKLKEFSRITWGTEYDHLNPGHARMCIGNRIRAAVKKGDEHVIAWLDKNQPVTNTAE